MPAALGARTRTCWSSTSHRFRYIPGRRVPGHQRRPSTCGLQPPRAGAKRTSVAWATTTSRIYGWRGAEVDKHPALRARFSGRGGLSGWSANYRSTGHILAAALRADCQEPVASRQDVAHRGRGRGARERHRRVGFRGGGRGSSARRSRRSSPRGDRLSEVGRAGADFGADARVGRTASSTLGLP